MLYGYCFICIWVLPKYHKIIQVKSFSHCYTVFHKKEWQFEPKFIARNKLKQENKVKENKSEVKKPFAKCSNKHNLYCVLDAAKSELWKVAKR